MDSYLLTVVDIEVFSFFETFLEGTELWCAHFEDGIVLTGALAEIVSIGIAEEISKRFFREAHAAPCQHRFETHSAENSVVLWDPRILVPTRSGLETRTALISGRAQLAGPHPLLRATEGFLPEIAPFDLAIETRADVFFQRRPKDFLETASMGRHSRRLCRKAPGEKIRTLLREIFFWITWLGRPIAAAVPKQTRLRIQLTVNKFFGQSSRSGQRSALVTKEIGFDLPVFRWES